MQTGGQPGGKVPLPGAHANAPTGACGIWHRQALVGQQRNKATLPFTRRTTSAVSAANECEGITCGSK